MVGCTNQETVKLLLWSLKICEGRVCLRSASKSWMLLVVVDLSKRWTASGCFRRLKVLVAGLKDFAFLFFFIKSLLLAAPNSVVWILDYDFGFLDSVSIFQNMFPSHVDRFQFGYLCSIFSNSQPWRAFDISIVLLKADFFGIFFPQKWSSLE